jgi:hypothetical protein
MSEDFAELKKLFPKLAEDDLAAARETLDAYLLLAWEIWEEHSGGGPENDERSTVFNKPRLTVGDASSSIQVKVDSPHIN